MPTDPDTAKSSAAFFDVDGTLCDTTIVHYYVYLRERRMAAVCRPFWRAGYMMKCLYFLWLDRGGKNRGRFNDYFYRGYRGMDAVYARGAAGECFEKMIKPWLRPAAIECIEGHRKAGRKIVLVTGSIDFLMKPLTEHLRADGLIAASLEEKDGAFTGLLIGSAVSGEEKARRLREYAERERIDLASSLAYGDSTADAEMLGAAGKGCVVNAGDEMARMADEKRWERLVW
jgi:alcohol-forming fatty acyl-CoA reductase